MTLDLPYNLSLPLAVENETNSTNDGGLKLDNDLGIPGALVGIILPHVICTLFVLLRVCSRLACLKKWFVDDTLMVIAWIWSTAVCTVYGLAVQAPGIRDARITTESSIVPYLLRTYLGLIFYQLCLCFTKLSIAAFYLRMLSSKPAMRWLSWATIVLVVGFGVPLLFMSLLQCYPTKGRVLGRPMGCLDFTELLVFSSCMHTATDAWLIILIVPTISRLDLPTRQKVALTIILSLGIFVIAASMIRLQLSLHKDFRPTTGVQGSNTMAFFIMTVLECDTAIICASAPMIRPIISKMWPPSPKEQPRIRQQDRSFNLTTVVSYHGYPWTEPNTPLVRSRNGSLANMRVSMPRPPIPAFNSSHRTPTSLSLKSMVSARLPRSRGLTMTGPDTTPILDKACNEAESRRTSVGFEGYEDQYLGYGEKKKSKFKGSPIKVIGSSKEWSSSQESFMSPKDPASPRTLGSNPRPSGDTSNDEERHHDIGGSIAQSLRDIDKPELDR
ncbi:hypothetical protein JX265_010559 [Neoarthrinium moseri]|uniref:Rhodopsin domain-containing protein n=1 Tax=Neoarthrinium moseri TaxID=1658444 RepID=A0A9P9WE61_9PEZI|nr:uncharacterized protein JN550_011094 [Neoarthrinium moseri]KAI1846182.1 hypothetical protein JX266_007707 [Neoarthrinium moseri]KAI1859082.1 hypothetical protein JX265_010559 [Neoarthrinium moseri]KAI1860939.1 hypothetical protein JN550_011094 [Neoarthrinium moseri]